MAEAAQLTESAQLSYLRQGAGEVLVLVHGYLGGASIWRDQLEVLSADFDVIAPELPGYGDSHAAEASDTIAGYARQVLNLLDQLDVSRFHLLGHSMGGMIAQEMTALAPERVNRLICYGTGPQGVLPDRFETIEQSRARLRTEGVGPTARNIAAKWFSAGEAAPHFASCVALGQNVSTTSALAGLSAMESWDGRAALADIRQPALIIWGDRDQSYGWQQPEALWRGIPNSSLAVMPGCGHNAHQENETLFNSIIRDFLTDEAPNGRHSENIMTTNQNQSTDNRA